MPSDHVEDGRREAILAAALDVLAEVGFDRLTMDAVAARARASKATLYRHWDGKTELVTDALRARVTDEAALPDTGSVRGDLLAGLGTLVSAVRDHDLDLCQGLLTAMRSEPELAGCVRQQVFTHRCDPAREWVDREIARGTLPADADAVVLTGVALPMIFMRLLVTGEPVDGPFLERVVDEVVLPLLHRTTPPPSPSPGGDHLDGRSNPLDASEAPGSGALRV